VKRIRKASLVLAIVAAVAILVEPMAAAMKIQVDFIPEFDFSKAKTWGWNAKAPGQIVLARSGNDDVEAVRKLADPVIMDVVATEMPARKLTKADASPDLTLQYFMLLTVGQTAQELGQFVGTVNQWALPPWGRSTTSLEAIQNGSVVLDMSAEGKVVFRGVARAEMKLDASPEKREKLLREAVTGILKQFPPKKK